MGFARQMGRESGRRWSVSSQPVVALSLSLGLILFKTETESRDPFLVSSP